MLTHFSLERVASGPQWSAGRVLQTARGGTKSSWQWDDGGALTIRAKIIWWRNYESVADLRSMGLRDVGGEY